MLEFTEFMRNTPLWFGVIWAVGWTIASILYRRSNGKPILGSVEGAKFLHKYASGYSHKSIITRLGNASNCLIVAVKDNTLIVRPIFPFNLFFLPEIYDLEHTIPFSKIDSVELKRSLFSKKIVVTFRNERSDERRISLWVKDRDQLLSLLPGKPAYLNSVSKQ